MNWNHLESVIELARKMPGSVVKKQPGRDNFNIVHKSRTDLYKEEWVVWSPEMANKKAGKQERNQQT